MNHKTLMLVEIAILTTLAFLLDTIPGLQFTIWPQGGSVSFAMIPVFIIAFRWGLKAGLASGLIFGVLDLLFGGTVVHWLQGLLDYIVAFVGLGVAGVFASGIRKNGLSNNDSYKSVYVNYSRDIYWHGYSVYRTLFSRGNLLCSFCAGRSTRMALLISI